MSMHLQFGLTRVINARGTFTPLGVSRSSGHVGRVVAQALGEFFILDELQSLLSRKVAEMTGAEARACLTIEPEDGHWNAAVLAQKLRAGRPSIWLMEHEANDGRLMLELVPLLEEEMQEILDRVAELVRASGH